MSYNEPVKTNGTETKPPSLISEIFAQLSDLFDLAALEFRYEFASAARQLLAFAIAIVLAITAFSLLQFSLVFALMKFGLSLGLACLLLAGVYALIAVGVVALMGRRDAKVGMPFDATQREVKESLRWIQKLFS